MSNLSQSQARAALHALFEPRPTFVEAVPAVVVELPRNLDDAIAADAAQTLEGELFRWYRGVDSQGVRRVFRFQRGKSLAAWHALLVQQRLTSVDGPFRTQLKATAVA